MKKTREKITKVTTKMSKAYQITVPSVVRKMLDLKPGDTVDFELDKGRVRLAKALTREQEIKQMFAEFDQLNRTHWERMTPEEREFAKKTAGWTVQQWHDYIDNLPETKAYVKEKYDVQ